MYNFAREVDMKRIIKLLALVGVAFLMFGCMDMFTMNIFAGLDAPRVPSAEDISAMDAQDLLNTVGDLVESDSFYDDIAAEEAASGGSSETKVAILDGLNAIITDAGGQTTPEAQNAALLIAEIELNTTVAGVVVDSFVNVATGLLDQTSTAPDPADTQAFTEYLIGQVFTDIPKDQTSVGAGIAALLSAADAYTYYGESLSSTGTVAVPAGDNIGAIAQDAVVSLLVAELINAGISEAQLTDFIVNGTPLPVVTFAGDPLTTNLALSNILEASGIGAAFGLGGV